jgi:hypothetical protein
MENCLINLVRKRKGNNIRHSLFSREALETSKALRHLCLEQSIPLVSFLESSHNCENCQTDKIYCNINLEIPFVYFQTYWNLLM